MPSPTKLLLFLAIALVSTAKAASPNWTGPWSPCRHHSDLLRRDHVDLALKISTTNLVLAREFERALDFWAGVLDIDWHEVTSQDCAIQLVDGTPELFSLDTGCACVAARSQLPDRLLFEGWIAFNERVKFTDEEMFRDSIHEIGHLLGLPHNPNSASVMYSFDFDQNASLDAADMEALAARHKLRPGIFLKSPLGIDLAATPHPPSE